MTRSDPDDAPPTWFRLSEASWAEIAAAYRQGATAKSLARQWKVSPTSVYRHACRDGWPPAQPPFPDDPDDDDADDAAHRRPPTSC